MSHEEVEEHFSLEDAKRQKVFTIKHQEKLLAERSHK
jgi:hypothetical protein